MDNLGVWTLRAGCISITPPVKRPQQYGLFKEKMWINSELDRGRGEPPCNEMLLYLAHNGIRAGKINESISRLQSSRFTSLSKWFLSIPLRATSCVKDQYHAGAVVLLHAFSPGRLVREWMNAKALLTHLNSLTFIWL